MGAIYDSGEVCAFIGHAFLFLLRGGKKRKVDSECNNK